MLCDITDFEDLNKIKKIRPTAEEPEQIPNDEEPEGIPNAENWILEEEDAESVRRKSLRCRKRPANHKDDQTHKRRKNLNNEEPGRINGNCTHMYTEITLSPILRMDMMSQCIL